MPDRKPTTLPWAKASQVTIGTKVICDKGFTCIRPGKRTVRGDHIGLFLLCYYGRHYLDGQLNAQNQYVGISLVPPNANPS